MPGAVLLAVVLLAVAPLAPALAYWQLTPQVDSGVTYETNPRYISDEAKAAQEALDPGATANVMGNYLDARIEAVYQTPTDQWSLTPRIRKTDYLKSNRDLNDDDLYLDFSALHGGTRGNISLAAAYQETGVRTSEFDSATPDNPDDPLPTGTGGGRFSDTTQKTLNLRPTLNYQVSPRNIAGLSGEFSDTSYSRQRSDTSVGGYLDYKYSSVDLSVRHYLNAKNSFGMALNGGNFIATQAGTPFENSTDSFGINASYDHTFSETLSGNATAGVSRSSVNVSGIRAGFDPLTGFQCSPAIPCTVSNEERNFTGNVSLRRRSELTTMNLSLARQIAPRSDGTEVVQDQLRFFIERPLTRKLRGSLGAVASQESAVGRIFQQGSATGTLARQDRTYVTVDSRIAWQLTEALSAYGTYTYVSDKNSRSTGNDSQVQNNRLYFGILYRAIVFRR
ncbi:MAG: hypothetical protein ABI567_05990 [Gammaproteobacteria bacterium]